MRCVQSIRTKMVFWHTHSVTALRRAPQYLLHLLSGGEGKINEQIIKND